jgi:hypothetical protein
LNQKDALSAIPEEVQDALRKIVRRNLENLPMTPSVAEILVSAPWLVTIRYDKKNNADPKMMDQFAGVGALIGKRQVVTSGHLFDVNMPAQPADADEAARLVLVGERDHFVRVGAVKIDEGDRYEIVEVKTNFNVLAPMGGDLAGPMNDIAVITLDRDVDVEPIPLAASPVAVGDRISVLGWPNGPFGHGNLTQVNTVVVPAEAGVAAGQRKDELAAANCTGPDYMQRGYSGAPVIQLRQAGTVALVGVASRGIPLELGDGLQSPLTFADAAGAHREFIEESLASVPVQ